MSDKEDSVWRFSAMKPEIGDLSRSTVWRLEKQGQFPKRVQLSPNCVGWRKSEVLDWLASRETA